jgi:hypothetical protein
VPQAKGIPNCLILTPESVLQEGLTAPSKDLLLANSMADVNRVPAAGCRCWWSWCPRESAPATPGC